MSVGPADWNAKSSDNIEQLTEGVEKLSLGSEASTNQGQSSALLAGRSFVSCKSFLASPQTVQT